MVVREYHFIFFLYSVSFRSHLVLYHSTVTSTNLPTMVTLWNFQPAEPSTPKSHATRDTHPGTTPLTEATFVRPTSQTIPALGTSFISPTFKETNIRFGLYSSSQDLSEFHTTGIDDLGGCALAIAYESDATAVKPEDFAIFSVNQTCVWTLHTDFQVPAAMPACPEGGCTCAWFWIHTVRGAMGTEYFLVSLRGADWNGM